MVYRFIILQDKFDLCQYLCSLLYRKKHEEILVFPKNYPRIISLNLIIEKD